MNLKQLPDLLAFFSNYVSNSDSDSDVETIRAFAERSKPEQCQAVVSQTLKLLELSEIPLEELGSEANRWFGDSSEARDWLEQIVTLLSPTEGSDTADLIVVKDSNGTVLSEGDSVITIKDLKVKGGSSDLKRGTTIRKIHLIGDPDNIECRVDGSTLVLKTCFLKKA